MLQNWYTDKENSPLIPGQNWAMMGSTRSSAAESRSAIVNILPTRKKSRCESGIALRVLGWTSVAVGVVAVGFYVGQELRSRYKFNHRTPSDFYAHAGDEFPAEYGVGI